MKKVLALVLCFCMALSLTACKSGDYEKAKKLFDAGKYEEALALYEKLGDYEDSAEKALFSRYHIAYNTHYIAATNAFYAIRNGEEAGMDEAAILAEYEKALSIFEDLGDYDDSREMVEKIKKEMVALLAEDAVREVLDLYEAGSAGAATVLNTYLETTEQGGMQYPYAFAFIERAKDVLEEDPDLAYFLANTIVTWAEKTNVSEYSADALYYDFPRLHWRTREVGETVVLGTCRQEKGGDVQPIKWIVLEKEGDKMLLLSQKGLRRGVRTEGYKSALETAFTYDELRMIDSLSAIRDLSAAEYAKYGERAGICTATYAAFTETGSGVYKINARHEWQIEKLDETPVSWFIEGGEIVGGAGSTEVYCRPAVWITVK